MERPRNETGHIAQEKKSHREICVKVFLNTTTEIIPLTFKQISVNENKTFIHSDQGGADEKKIVGVNESSEQIDNLKLCI